MKNGPDSYEVYLKWTLDNETATLSQPPYCLYAESKNGSRVSATHNIPNAILQVLNLKRNNLHTAGIEVVQFLVL